MLPRLFPRVVSVCTVNLPAPTQQACPLIPCCNYVSRLLAMKLTLLACIAGFAVLGVAAVLEFAAAVALRVAVVAGSVAVGACEGEGHRQCIELRSV